MIRNNQKLRLATLIALGISLAEISQAGQINVVGTGDGLEILREVATSFRASHSGVEVAVPPSIGSGGAISAVGGGRETIGRVARPLTESERASGIAYTPVFEIPSAFYVHPDVRIRDLTSKDLKRIFSGEVTNWRELGGNDHRIRVVRREDADSTLQVLRAAIPDFRELTFTERSKLAMTTQEAIDSIRDNPGAIGFGPYSTEFARHLGVIRLDGKAPLDAGYPANVVLALIHKPGISDGNIQAFIGYFAQPHVRRIIKEFGARPIAQ